MISVNGAVKEPEILMNLEIAKFVVAKEGPLPHYRKITSQKSDIFYNVRLVRLSLRPQMVWRFKGQARAPVRLTSSNSSGGSCGRQLSETKVLSSK